jgi:hypothetical protein
MEIQPVAEHIEQQQQEEKYGKQSFQGKWQATVSLLQGNQFVKNAALVVKTLKNIFAPM